MQLYHPTYNWYEVMYNDSLTHHKNSKNSKLLFNPKRKIITNTKDYKEALNFNASAIADSFQQPLEIMFSGGIDSEVIVRTNKDLGITQNVYIFKFENNLNVRDVKSAQEICNSLGIVLKVIPFNLKKFFENEAEYYFKKTFISRVEHLPRFKWFEKFNNLIVVGDGEPYLRRDLLGDYSKKSGWSYRLDEHEFWWTMYSHNNSNILGSWYHYTPEIFANFAKHQVIKDLTDDKFYGKQSTYSSRVKLNQSIWSTIKEKQKLVGFEGETGHPGSLPYFMESFKNSVMKDVTETPFSIPKNKFERIFK